LLAHFVEILAYKYHKQNGTARLRRNRLYQLFDDADPLNAEANESTDGSEDIGYLPETTFDEEVAELNGLHNYHYDALGNLIHDEREQIQAIQWTVAGKVKSVSRTTGSTRKPLTFAYGASGQRILKTVSDPDLDVTGSREHYIRDAQGNIMATYRYTNPGSASLQLNDRPLYGSARLGTLGKEMELHSLLNWDPADPVIVDPVDLNYELTDHLGNVCTVVTGRLMDGNGGGTLKQAELVSAQGYEPFGSLLPGRNYSSDSYRFGLNGQEKDDEVYGATGTSYTAEFWQYDPRAAKRWNIDPEIRDFPQFSPYLVFNGNPIFNSDPKGNRADGYVDQDGNYLGDDGDKTSHETRVISREKWCELGGDQIGKGQDPPAINEARDEVRRSKLQNDDNSTRLQHYEGGIRLSEETWCTLQLNGGQRLMPWLVNNSPLVVYWKPEGNTPNPRTDHRDALPCMPGTDVYHPLDGINMATRARGTVYRVPDATQVIVDANGVPDIIGWWDRTPRIGNIPTPSPVEEWRCLDVTPHEQR
jgi:hypothetical protein